MPNAASLFSLTSLPTYFGSHHVCRLVGRPLKFKIHLNYRLRSEKSLKICVSLAIRCVAERPRTDSYDNIADVGRSRYQTTVSVFWYIRSVVVLWSDSFYILSRTKEKRCQDSCVQASSITLAWTFFVASIQLLHVQETWYRTAGKEVYLACTVLKCELTSVNFYGLVSILTSISAFLFIPSRFILDLLPSYLMYLSFPEIYRRVSHQYHQHSFFILNLKYNPQIFV